MKTKTISKSLKATCCNCCYLRDFSIGLTETRKDRYYIKCTIHHGKILEANINQNIEFEILVDSNTLPLCDWWLLLEDYTILESIITKTDFEERIIMGNLLFKNED